MKKLTLSIPKEAHKKLKVLAAQTEQTMVNVILDCIEDQYEKMEAPGKMQIPSGGCQNCGAYSDAPYRVWERKLEFEHDAWLCKKCIRKLDDEQWPD